MLKELTCVKCNKTKSVDLFRKSTSKHGYKFECKDCYNKYRRQYRRKNPEKFKEYYLKERNKAARESYEKYRDTYYKYSYGISIDEYNEFMKLQNNKCAICHREEYILDHRTKKVRRLSVDHNHDTGKVRGLLCKNCNTGLGMLREDLNIINNLKIYLERNNV